MSGGLDSTMSALLLKQQGYEVVGLTLKTWHLHPQKQEKELAKASQPTPSNRCNPHMKWPWLLQKADALDCRHVATGHYVRKELQDGLWYIKKGADHTKDQSYFLWNLNQNILQRAMFPLGNLTKSEVRKMALENGLKETARKQESMGVCFLGGTNYREFLRDKATKKELTIDHGEIVDETGKTLGQHPGLPFFTIGQKRGLGLEDKEYFVKQMEPESNKIVVSKSATLSTDTLTLSGFQLTPSLPFNEEYEVDIRVRGIDKVPSLPGTITLKGNYLQVDFTKEAWGITPGQSIVFYKNDTIIGGGIVS
jgi:tRNA-specific 2-thiouridylase